MRALLVFSEPKELQVTIDLQAPLGDFIALAKQIDKADPAMKDVWPMSDLYSVIQDAVNQAEKSFYSFVDTKN